MAWNSISATPGAYSRVPGNHPHGPGWGECELRWRVVQAAPLPHGRAPYTAAIANLPGKPGPQEPGANRSLGRRVASNMDRSGPLSASKETVAQAASRAGRDISQITVAPQILCYAAETPEELAEGERLIRSQMAYYIGGMGSYYYDLFRRSGYQAEAEAIRSAWAGGDRGRAAGSVSDDMLENICIIGDPVTCRTRLEAYRHSGADLPIIAFPHGSSLSANLSTLEALAPRCNPAADSTANTP